MGKYIVELKKNETLYKAATRESDGTAYVCSAIGTPYTAPDLDAIRNEAYEKGVQDTKQHWVDAPRTYAYKFGYENGLNAAWVAARTLWNTPNRKEIFGHTIFNTVLTTLTAQEAIEKIRAHEQAQKEKEEQKQEESEESKKEQSVTVEEVMRQYLYRFCNGKNCTGCPLHTSDFTCGRGYHFLTNRVSDEEVRKAYATVLEEMQGEKRWLI